MPRRSAASFEVPRVDGRPAPLVAPAHLSTAAKRIWKAIVESVPPEHFRPSDAPLLRSFVESTALADKAAAELGAKGAVIDGKVSPWLVVQEKAQRSQATLAIRLRLCPSARTDPKSVGRRGAAGPDIGAYLGEGDDD